MNNDPFEFCPTITGDIPMDDRPRLRWRAFWRIFRVLRSERTSIEAPLSVGVAADQVLTGVFKMWWNRYCSMSVDPLSVPLFLRVSYFENTGVLMRL